jgi:uncharacterized protein YjbJ (UPF0337 family)
MKEVTMNAEQFKGKWAQFKGELKQKWGNFTDDDLMKIEGDYDKFKGSLQERYGDKKEEVSRWADDWFTRSKQPAGTMGR